MIIAISGKIGSGKDTVGSIIQYLCWRNAFKDEILIEQGENNFELYRNSLAPLDSTWDIKKFADGLKDMVCIILGCTRNELENHEFKNKELGEEWTKYYLHYYKLPDYRTMNGYYATELEALEDKQQNPKFTEFGVARGALEIKKIILTPRLLLQLLGTECLRNIIHPNVHVNMLMNKYTGIGSIDLKSVKYEKDNIVADVHNIEFPNWIITDMRFPNELEAVKSRKGISIRINRYPVIINTPKGTMHLTQEDYNEVRKVVEHPSETSLDYAEFDYIIDNNGSIEDLIEKVKEILIKENII